MNIEAKIPKKYQCIENKKAKTSYFDGYEFECGTDHFDSLKFYEKNYKIIQFIGRIPFLKNWYMTLIRGTLGFIYNKEFEYAEQMIRSLTIAYYSKDSFIRYDKFYDFRDARSDFIHLFDPKDSWDNKNYSRIWKYVDNDYSDISYAIYYNLSSYLLKDKFRNEDSEEKQKYEDFMSTVFKPENLFSEKMDEYIRIHMDILGDGGYLNEFI
ncbi:MAG: hypothetical protein IKR19_08405 [Acholeplasmatales bacterium]|nr:hypothetical protein [Acholeplasmatales bacterium]